MMSEKNFVDYIEDGCKKGSWEIMRNIISNPEAQKEFRVFCEKYDLNFSFQNLDEINP